MKFALPGNCSTLNGWFLILQKYFSCYGGCFRHRPAIRTEAIEGYFAESFYFRRGESRKILQSTPQSLRFLLLAGGENSHRSTKNIFAESKTIHRGWSSCPAGRIFSAAIKASYG